MAKVWTIARRIWAQFLHDPRTLGLLFLAPVVVLWLMSVLLVSDAYSPRIAVVDIPTAFELALRETDAEIRDVSADEAHGLLASGDVDAVLSMEPYAPTLIVELEGSDMNKNGAVNRVLAEANARFGEEARDELERNIQQKADEARQSMSDVSDALAALAAANPSLAQMLPSEMDSDLGLSVDLIDIMPVQSIQTEYLHGGSDWEMFDYYGPVFIALFLFVFVFITCSFSLVNERAAGTMERFLDTPVKPVQILAGYSLGFGVLSLVQVTVILWFALAVIGFPNEGSLGLVVFTAVSLAVASVTLGLLVSGLANTAFQVVQLMLLCVTPQILLCGLFDLSASPEWLQGLSQCLPLTYGVDAMRKVMLSGSGFQDVGVQLAVVWGFIAAFFCLAALKFRKKRARLHR